MPFAHLHTHTEYSLLDGSNKIKEYLKCVKALGQTSAAITDHGAMFGVIDFYKAAKDMDIHPVIGCEVYVAPVSRFDKEPSHGDDRYNHLVLLAENNIGYSNLMKIVSRGYTEGFYYKPRVDMEVLESLSEGLIALSACLAGAIPRAILRNNIAEAESLAMRLRQCFGEENFFLEIQDHGIPEQRTVNMELVGMSKRLGIPLAATNDVHYTYAQDAQAHDILLCIQTNKKINDTDRMRYEGGQFYVKSEDEMRELFRYAEEACDITDVIARRCQVEIEFHKTKLPHYEVENGRDSYEFLKELCLTGLKNRYGAEADRHLERLNFELDTIRQMGFVDYFLITWDFINYAKSKNIPVGPGRGSAAGSIVSYCLAITDIDPIKYQLIFERFLNPERVSMPDIDIDFCYERRGEVIDYVTEKYGVGKVVQIITFGTLAARGVIRDVARALDMPYAAGDKIAKMIPHELGITLEKALQQNLELRLLYEGDEAIKTLIDMGMKLEGLPRHSSTHAAGVVICPDNAEEFVPLAKGDDTGITTQFTMNTLEELGLLKMDFLGLRTLTVIDRCVKMIHSSKSDSKIDVDSIPYDDAEVYNMISKGHTVGVFQLESAGMTRFMKDLRPESIEDIIAGVSLYRPGPMDFIPKYVAGKHSRGSVTYPCPQLKPILEATYGCIVYQEQVMQIVRELGGYTLGRSDMVRRAMSKKKQSVMEQEKANFIYGNVDEGVPGCIAQGIDKKVAENIFNDMMDFAKYAFNKSHAAAYAVIAYQTAYLKYYYPKEFMASMLTSVIDHANSLVFYVGACKTMEIEFVTPSINEGKSEFSVSDGRIVYALAAIKGVGHSLIDAIVAEREARGKFKGLREFIERCLNAADIGLNKKALESFIKAGALDCLGETRKSMMIAFEGIIEGINKEKKGVTPGQTSLFDLLPESEAVTFSDKIKDYGEYEKPQLLEYEREVLGFYVSGHPLDDHFKLLKQNTTANASMFIMDEEIGEAEIADGKMVTVGGMIERVKTKTTKSDKLMAFVTLSDLTGSAEILVFPKDYERYSKLLAKDALVFIEGRASIEEGKDAKLLCQRVTKFEDIGRKIWVMFQDIEDYYRKERTVKDIVKNNPGKDRLIAYIKDTKQMKELTIGSGFHYSLERKEELSKIAGEGGVRE